MKKSLLIFCSVFTLTTAFSQGGYLPNSSFENWTNTVIYENPDLWQSSNYTQASVENVVKSTDAQHLAASLELQTVLVGQDTAFAYAFLGNVGQSGPDEGVPYAATVDELRGYYKGNIMTNDTAVVFVIKFLAGNIVGMDSYNIYTSQSAWTPFTMPLTSGAQDSIFIGLLSSNPFVYPTFAKPGTTILFDNIYLNHSTLGAGPSLPNYSFETWTPVDIDNPDGWTTLNSYFASVGLAPVTETSDANTGLSAARIETMTINADTIPGFVFYADFDISNGNVIPIPYNASPTSLNLSYKYTAVGGDQAFVSMEFYNSGNIVGGGQMMLNPSASYNSITLGTNISSTPDSIAMGFFAGNNPGSVLIIDDVQFSGGDLAVNPFNFNFTFETYPNPATDRLTVYSNELTGVFTISIFDLNGKVISSRQGSAAQTTTVDVSDLPAGIYQLQLNSNGKSMTKQISIIR